MVGIPFFFVAQPIARQGKGVRRYQMQIAEEILRANYERIPTALASHTSAGPGSLWVLSSTSWHAHTLLPGVPTSTWIVSVFPVFVLTKDVSLGTFLFFACVPVCFPIGDIFFFSGGKYVFYTVFEIFLWYGGMQ